MSKNLVMFTLNSGQEVIAEQWDVGDVWVDVKHALVIQVVPQGPNQYGIALIPLSPTNPESRMRIFNHAIVAQSLDPIPNELANAYVKQTSSIEIVSSLPGQL